MNNFDAYVAGFFDGEGSVCIFKDSIKVIIQIGQRTKHRGILEAIQREFGGTIYDAKRGDNEWSDYSKWQLQKRADIERFLARIGPLLIVKATQAWLVQEFYASIGLAPEMRDARGRVLGQTGGF